MDKTLARKLLKILKKYILKFGSDRMFCQQEPYTVYIFSILCNEMCLSILIYDTIVFLHRYRLWRSRVLSIEMKKKQVQYNSLCCSCKRAIYVLLKHHSKTLVY